jgi:hypothetical protein
MDRTARAGEIVRTMKNSNNAAELLNLSYLPEAEEYLDELERSGQFRIGVDAENDDSETGEPAASNDYSLSCGSGSVSIQDWWTTGRVALRLAPGIDGNGVVLQRVDDSLLVRTLDGLDSVRLEGYLGLIPDASTLRIVFESGDEWAGAALTSRIAG